jgi:phosphopantetheinyl transferase
MKILSFSQLGDVRVAVCRDPRECLRERDEFLTKTEQEALSRIGHRVRRDQSMAVRILLKRLIVKTQGCDPLQVRLVKKTSGGLRLRGAAKKQQVSVSHSGAWMAVAVAKSAVGVDIQENRRLKNENAFRRRISSKQDRGLEDVKTLDLWALKEAVVKARGRGLVSEVSLRVISARMFRAKLGRMSFDCALKPLSRGVRLAVARRRGA